MTKAFVEEWSEMLDKLRQSGPTLETVSRWQELQQEYLDSGRTNDIDIDTIGNVVYLGWNIAILSSNYHEAVSIWDNYFNHPSIANAEANNLLTYRSCLAFSYLFVGEEIQAVSIIRALLKTEPRSLRRTAVLTIRSDLRYFCLHQDEDIVVSEAFAELARDVARMLPHHSRLDLTRGLPTYGEVREFLEAS